MNKYQIFIAENVDFGLWGCLSYNDKDVANVIAKDFIQDGMPVITVAENKFKVWNSNATKQPIKVDFSEHPVIEKIADKYESAALYDHPNLGLLELYAWNYDRQAGVKKVRQSMFTYKEVELFSVRKYT